MCGWNEPEQVQYAHVELKVDVGPLTKLRAGYAALAAPPTRVQARPAQDGCDWSDRAAEGAGGQPRATARRLDHILRSGLSIEPG